MDSALQEVVQDWLLKALSDLETARLVAATPGMRTDTAIYHCQQVGEKALKGFLAAQNDDIEKTHDVRKLLQACAAFDAAFLQWMPDAIVLNPYATIYRYPGLSSQKQPSRIELDEALLAAQRLYDFVTLILPPETRPR